MHLLSELYQFISNGIEQLFGAWSAWAHPHIPAEAPHLWGIAFLWWGRIGRCMQFLGVVSLLLDVLGVDRIRALGTRIGTIATLRRIKRFWIGIRAFLRAVNMWRPSRRQAERRMKRHSLLFTCWFGGALLFALFRMVLEAARPTFVGGPKFLHILYVIFEGFGGFLQGIIFVSPGLILLAAIFLVTGGFLINVIILQPMAWLLSHPRLKLITQVMALVFVTLGFHFVLLAS